MKAGYTMDVRWSPGHMIIESLGVRNNSELVNENHLIEVVDSSIFALSNSLPGYSR